MNTKDRSCLLLRGLAAALCVVFVATLFAQQPEAPPVFRSAIEAVQMDVFVTDADGNPVRGLTIDDFELVENGKPLPITTFQAVDIPIERAETVEREWLAEPDVLTNDTPPGRVYLFALDEVRSANILRTRRFVRQFIEEHFGPNDLGAIALVGRGLATDGQDFTSNRRLLLNAIDRFSGGFDSTDAPASTPEGDCVAYSRLPAGAGDGYVNLASVRSAADPGGREPGPRASGLSQQMASLRSMAEMMARIPGRHKAMLLFTECLDIDVLDLVDYNGGLLTIRGEDAHAAMAAATRSNMAIYPIDPTGLDPTVTIPLETIGAFRSLGEATGGFALVNSNRFTEAFERIVRENSTYYMLAFNSAYDKDDGKYVRVQVRVKQPGLTVHAREGYVAPSRRLRQAQERARGRAPTSAVGEALASPLATRGIPMRVFAAPFKGRGRDATVPIVVEIDAASLGLTDDGGTVSGTFDLRLIATDATRRVWPEVAHTASVAVKPGPSGRVPLEDLRVRVVSEMELPKGRYQVRVAAGSAIVAGNVVYDLEVPDFTDGPLTMSGVVLMSRAEPAVLTLRSSGRRGTSTSRAVKCYSEICTPPPAAPGAPAQAAPATGDAWLDGRLSGPPTTVREFARADPVALAVEVYDNIRRNAKDPPHTMTLAAELRSADGTLLPLAAQQRASTATKSPSGGHSFELSLPFDDVSEGAYVLRVQARSSRDDRHVVTRELPVRIR